MTSRDQLSFKETLWDVLPSFSDGRSSVGPKTVARLWRDILLRLSISVTLPEIGEEVIRILISSCIIFGGVMATTQQPNECFHDQYLVLWG